MLDSDLDSQSLWLLHHLHQQRNFSLATSFWRSGLRKLWGPQEKKALGDMLIIPTVVVWENAAKQAFFHRW